MKKRVYGFLLTALLGVAALSGCTGGKTSGDEHSTEPTIIESSESVSEQETSQAQETPEPEKQDPRYGGKIVVGVQQDIDSLDPHKATAAGTKEILFNIFEGLLKTNENGKLSCAVASKYSLSEDGLVYTFTLRDNVKFHDGSNVTAEDVKYSLERASGLLDGTTLVSSLKTLTSVEIVDEKTVKVTTSSANLELDYAFTTAIIPKGSGEKADSTPIGTGPFSFVSYKPQEGLVMAKNKDYWQEGIPFLDEVDFKIITGADTALMELKGHSIDVYPYLTDSQAEELKDDYQILSAPSAVVQALFFNNKVAPLNNKKVRQAICYALDKDLVNDFVTGGKSSIISSAMLPGLRDYYEDLNMIHGTGANIPKALELLTEAGYPDGIELTITVPSNYEAHVQTAEVIAEQLKDAGIVCKIDLVEWETWLSDVYNDRKYQSTVCGITCDMTPGHLLTRFQSDSKKNFVNYSNSEFDKVFQKAEACLDMADKSELYRNAQRILCEDAASAFIEEPPITIAMNKQLTGYKFYPVYVQDMSTVYFNR